MCNGFDFTVKVSLCDLFGTERESDNISRLITGSGLLLMIGTWDLISQRQIDHINQMIILSVITLSGFHCTVGTS